MFMTARVVPWCKVVARRCEYISVCVGLCVARFDRSGNARAFKMWNEQKAGSTFFMFMREDIICNLPRGAGGADVTGLNETPKTK